MYRYVVVCEMCNNLVKSVFAHSSSSHLPPKLLTDSKQALQELTLFSSSVRERCKNEETSSQFAHATSYSTKLSLLASETNVGQFFDFFVITSTPCSLKFSKLLVGAHALRTL
jgi:hypothetical protein